MVFGLVWLYVWSVDGFVDRRRFSLIDGSLVDSAVLELVRYRLLKTGFYQSRFEGASVHLSLYLQHC